MTNNHIPLPSKIYFETDEKYKSKAVIEPLYPGYGVTIGNALRRVLLSSLPGSAVVAVKYKEADHEFSTLPNVVEDVVDIALNLKKLRLKINSEEQIRLNLQAKGNKAVTAADIKPDSRVEIINPDLHIATLDGKTSELVMEIIVQNGRGYVPVEARENEKLEIGTIAIDAIFTPMRNVNFEVENVRVGQMTNFDKLTITMETDGTINGREALDIASQILVEHFALLKTIETAVPEEVAKEIKTEEIELKPEDLGEKPEAASSAQDDLKTLGLSNRAYNALVKNNVRTIRELKGTTKVELGAMDGLGAKSIEEILKVMEQLP